MPTIAALRHLEPLDAPYLVEELLEQVRRARPRGRRRGDVGPHRHKGRRRFEVDEGGAPDVGFARLKVEPDDDALDGGLELLARALGRRPRDGAGGVVTDGRSGNGDVEGLEGKAAGGVKDGS